MIGQPRFYFLLSLIYGLVQRNDARIMDDGHCRSILKTSNHRHGHSTKTVTWSDQLHHLEAPQRWRKSRVHADEVCDDRMAYVPVKLTDRPKSHRTPRYNLRFEHLVETIDASVLHHPKVMKRLAIMQQIDENIRRKMNAYNAMTQSEHVYHEGRRRGRFYYTPSLNKHYI